MGAGVSVTGTEQQSAKIETRLETEALFVASLVSKVVDDAFPGRQVAVRARVSGNSQPAENFLKQQFSKPGNGE